MNRPPAAAFEMFFAALNAAGMAWCHWKSNEHLEAAIAGDTDADLLFDTEKQYHVVEMLKASGFVLFQPAPHRAYRDVVDALAFDAETGRLLHAHCHFSLTLGEKHLKSYRFPFEKDILARRKDIGGGIYVSDPADEYILLCIREALKMRLRDIFATQPWGGESVAPELKWLKERVTKQDIQMRAPEFLDKALVEHLVSIYDEGTQGNAMIALAHDLRSYAAEEGWRSMSPLRARLAVAWREVVWIASRIQSRFDWDCPFIARRRTLPGGGRIIAFLGVDGSGKSTISRAVLKILQKKIDARLAYFGTGDGPKTVLQKIALLIKKTRKPSGSSSSKLPTGWKNILWALLAVWQKKQVLHRALYLRARGVTVLCDRYPQNQFSGLNDGPRLRHLLDGTNKLKKAAARYEARYFALFDQHQPDIVLRLMPSLDIALARKPGDVAPDMLQKKMDSLKALAFSSHTQIKDVDADQCLEVVLNESLQSIWERVAA